MPLYEAPRFPSSWRKPLFDNSFEKRRLRILNGLFTLLESLGMKCSVSGKEGRYICIKVGTTDVSLSLDSPENLEKDFSSYYIKEAPPGTPLHLKISQRNEIEEIQTKWETSRIDTEKCLKEIAFSIIMAGEIFYRNHALHIHEWKIQRKENAIENQRLEKEESERKERDRLKKLEEARVGYLLGLGEDLNKAEKIRDLVASMKTKFEAGLLEVSAKDFKEWSTWGLQQADKLDPIVSGTVLESIKLKDAPISPDEKN